MNSNMFILDGLQFYCIFQICGIINLCCIVISFSLNLCLTSVSILSYLLFAPHLCKQDLACLTMSYNWFMIWLMY